MSIASIRAPGAPNRGSLNAHSHPTMSNTFPISLHSNYLVGSLSLNYQEKLDSQNSLVSNLTKSKPSGRVGRAKVVRATLSGFSIDGGDAQRIEHDRIKPTIKACHLSSDLDGEPCSEGPVIIRDDLNKLIQCLPDDMRSKLLQHPRRSELLEVVLDLGRRPEARFLGDGEGEYLRDEDISSGDLEAAQAALGEFGGDNRAGVEGTLHRISAIRNRKGRIIGLTCRVGRAVTGHVDMIRDVLNSPQSLLFLGRPGVGKTTVIREIARVLADDLHKRVVIVDTSNEIGGDGDVPHPAIGGARRMQVSDPALQHKIMIEAVENHMPEVVIVDEIGTEAEALACRTIAERGVMLVGTAHGQMLENLIKNPTLCDLIGGIQSVTLGDEEARYRGTQKSVLERRSPSTFSLVIEMRERSNWVVHQADKSVDALLQGKRPLIEVRSRNSKYELVVERKPYDMYNSKPVNDNMYNQQFLSPDISKFNNVGTAARELTYSWAEKLGYVPDKDAIAEQASNMSMAVSNYSYLPYVDDGGYDRGNVSSGKRGSKRGPRGIKSR